MTAVVTDEVAATLAKSSIEDKAFYGVETDEEKIEQKASTQSSQKIASYMQRVQTKYLQWSERKDAVDILHEEAKKLMPLYVKANETMLKRGLSFDELDFETMKPLMEFKALQRAVERLTTLNQQDVSSTVRSRKNISHAPPPPQKPPAPPPYPPPRQMKQKQLDSSKIRKRGTYLSAFNVEKRENVINFLKWAKKWLDSDKLKKYIESRCKGKGVKEKQRIIYNIFEEGYNKEWIRSVEQDLNLPEETAENRLMIAYEVYVNRSKKDYYYYYMQKLYKTWQKAEDECFHVAVYGAEKYRNRKERDKKVRNFHRLVQEKYIGYLNEEDDDGDDIDKLNQEFVRLVPLYKEIREKIQSGKVDPDEMDFESMKPMIEFQVLRQIMDRLVNVNGGGCGGCCGGCCGPRKQAQPIRMPEEQKQKKKTFKRKIQSSRRLKSNRKPTNQGSKETEGMLTTT